MVHQLKQDFPELDIIINGGLQTLNQCLQQLPQESGHLDGVMMGREAYSNPYILADVDKLFYGDDHDIPSRHEIAANYIDYCRDQVAQGQKLHHMSRHMLGLFQGVAGARMFRRHISENIHRVDNNVALLEDAVGMIRDA